MFHVEGNHLAQAEAQHRVSFGGFTGQRIEVQYKDADNGVRNHKCDGLRARRYLIERTAQVRGDRLLVTHIGFADAGHQ